jgi:hypothetical protein
MTGNVTRHGGDRKELPHGLEFQFMTDNRRAWRWLKLLQEEPLPGVVRDLKEIMPSEVRSAIADVYRRAG